MSERSPASGVRFGAAGVPNIALSLDVPAELVDAIADAVVARLAEVAPASSPYLSVEEAAKYLRCPPSRIYDLHASGRVEALRDGRRLLFTRSALDAALEGDGMSGRQAVGSLARSGSGFPRSGERRENGAGRC